MTDIISKVGYLAGATRLRRIAERQQAEGDKIYAEHGLNFKATWFATYYTLLDARTPLTLQQITASIGFTHITVKNITREMELNGIVKIKPNPQDARSKHVVLTSKGLKLLDKLQPIWNSISKNLEQLLTSGHPDFINIIGRIERETDKKSLLQRIMNPDHSVPVKIIDYRPSLKNKFHKLAGSWLEDLLDGKVGKEDEFALTHPDKAYLESGGFVFYAVQENKVIGCVALKRLNEYKFELCKLYVHPEKRRAGVATGLIERCITRCKENEVAELWLQTPDTSQETQYLYSEFNFKEAASPKEMTVLKYTQKILQLKLM